jgi:membrane-bound lytic murein transglycosylase MltF
MKQLIDSKIELYFNDKLKATIAKIICEIESNYNVNAKSQVGAIGLFQFMPSTFRQLTRSTDYYDIEKQIQAFDKYFFNEIPHNLKYFNIPDTIENRLISYNFGIGNLKERKKLPSETLDYLKKFREKFLNNIVGILW